MSHEFGRVSRGHPRQPLLIFPYNGNGREALDALSDAYELLAFIDDTAAKQGLTALKHKVLGREALDLYSEARVLAVPGSAVSYLRRRDVINSLGVRPDRFATVVHKTASVSASAHVGQNVLIMAGVVITAGAWIGDHVCVLPNTVIHHDARIGDWSLVGANVTIAGNTVLGENCYIGSGSSIINDVCIGSRVLIGLGSNVIGSVADNMKVVGNPARPIGTIQH